MTHENTKLTIYLIRHAESVMNTKPELIGGKSETTPLTKKGEKQSIKLGKKLAREGISFDHVYSSPLLRSLQTCNLVTTQVGFPINEIIQVPALEEIDQGKWEGLDRRQILTSEILATINSKGMLFTPPEGESQKIKQRDVANWFDKEILFNPHYLDSPKTVAAFSHGVTLKCLLQDLMHFDASFIYKMYLGNTGYIQLFLDKRGLFVQKFISHP